MVIIKNFLAIISWYSGIGPLVRFFREPKELLIAYHSINEPDISCEHVSINYFAFKKHIAYLEKRGYIFRHVRDATSNMKGKHAYIYFDDGFRTVFDTVYPYLKQKNISATFFIATEYIEQGGNDGMYLGWDEVRNMQDVFEIGSHSKHHIKLNKVSLREASDEMKDSKQIIEEKLGSKVSSFSYPKGRSNDELEREAHKLGYAITTADSRFSKVRPDPADSLPVFKWKMFL